MNTLEDIPEGLRDDLSTKTVMIIDNGLFVEIAKTLSKSFHRTLYYCRWEGAFPRSNQYVIGQGIEGVERVHNIFEYFDEVDLFCFPDIYDAQLQKHLESLGKLVFGGRSGDEMELYRHAMKEHMKKVGLYVTNYEIVTGVDNLIEYLKEHPNVWVKQNVTRGDFECVDDQTEIFTENGWKFFEDLTESEKVLTLNPETLDTEFILPSHYFKSEYDGEMYSIESDKVSMLTTPMHKYYVKNSAKMPYKYKKIEDCYKNLKSGKSGFTIPIGFNWNGNSPETYTIPETHSQTWKSGDRKIDIKDWLEFLGWFISEGSCTFKGHNKTKHCVNISQCINKNREKYDEIESLLKRIGYNYQIEGKIGFSIYNKSLFYELKNTCYEQTECDHCGKLTSCCHSKKVPDYVKNMSPELIEIFLTSYNKGDGYISKTKWSDERRYNTSSILLANDVQELIMKCGRVGKFLTVGKKGDIRNYKGVDFINRCDQYEIRELQRTTASILKHHISITKYKGMIYDVTVEPYHSILVRRNGKYCWTGNTFYSKNYLLIEPVIEELSHKLGAIRHTKEFIVEDSYDNAVETGMDCYCIDGQYPSRTLAGIEVKDAGYVGKMVDYDNLPDCITNFNTKMSNTMRDFGYKGFFSTEIRVSDKLPEYMVDFCARAGSPPSEAYQLLYTNLAEIIWYGSKGIMLDPMTEYKYVVEVLLHSSWSDMNWQAITFPKKYRDNIKLRNACVVNGRYYCAPQSSGLVEMGAIVACGNTLKEAIDKAKEIAETVEGHYIEIKLDSLDHAQEEFKRLKEMGIDLLGA